MANSIEARLKAEAKRMGTTVDKARQRMVLEGLQSAERRHATALASANLVADILLVTATPTERNELENVAHELGFQFDLCKGHQGHEYYRLGTVGTDRVIAIKLKDMGAFGTGGAAASCIRAKAETQATSFILLGTAFGVIPKHQKIGDVLVSESVFLYDNRDANAVEPPWFAQFYSELFAEGSGLESGFVSSLRATHARSCYAIEHPATAHRFASASLLERFRASGTLFKQPGEPRVQFGTLLSGGTRVSSSHFRDELVRGVPANGTTILGGEMEACGAISASADWIVVKGVSDFGDPESRAKIKANRGPAAAAAARVVLRTLANAATLP